jgi:cyclic-di-GMP-binding protein
MPSFDIVSKVDKQILSNAVDQANRLVSNRFDFKGVDAHFELSDFLVTLSAEVDFQVDQMLDILKSILHKNDIDIACLDISDHQASGKEIKQVVTVRTGLESLLCKKIIKIIKDSKLKVQAQIQNEQVRVTGKKRNDLQQVMAIPREADIDMPLQFDNFRD